jgi:flagella basal body P-ring formation protein FlgA
MRAAMLLLALSIGAEVAAETVVATSTLRAQHTLTEANVRLDPTDTPGGASSLDDVLGFELKQAVYAGRPIMLSNLNKAAIIERNQPVRAFFVRNGLTIVIEARALERGSVGDIIQIMNITSRNTLYAEVTHDGKLKVDP